jgi:hypothetical protein
MALTPLTPSKLAHIVANRAIMRQGRMVGVAAAYRTAYGGFQYSSVQIVLKQVDSADPLVRDQTEKMINEFLAELDPSLDPRPIVFFALTGGATDDASVAAAWKLEVLSYRRVGFGVQPTGADVQDGPPGDRWLLELRRMR